MSAAATRSAQASPDMRQLGVAVGALILAVTLLVAVAFSQQAATRISAAPATITSPADHDHGWSSDTTTRSTAIRRNGFDKAHAPAGSTSARGFSVSGPSGGILYTGIPYPAPADNGTGGANGTRFAQ